MSDLAEFVLARIAEDEGWARAASPWATGSRDYEQPVDWRRHMWNWSPARVLAECAAKRRIVELHDGEDDACLEPGFSSPGNCDTLRLLAQPYADHEGFREEWKVQ